MMYSRFPVIFLVGCGEAFTPAGLSVDSVDGGSDSGGSGSGGEGDAGELGAGDGAAGGALAPGAGGRSAGGAVGSGGMVSSGGAAGGETGSGGEDGDGGTPIECLTDLSGVGTGDFSIRFTLTTTATPAEYMALLNQRSRCDNTLPGWDVWMKGQGNLEIMVFDGGGSAYANVTDNRPINDGAPHRISVARSGSSLTIGVDGIFNTYPGQPIMPLASLSPLNVGIDPTCTGVSNLSGRVVDICLTK